MIEDAIRDAIRPVIPPDMVGDWSDVCDRAGFVNGESTPQHEVALTQAEQASLAVAPERDREPASIIPQIGSPTNSTRGLHRPALGEPKRRPLTRRPAFVAGLAAVLLALGTGAAFANDVNPFSGIAAFVGLTAADRAQTSQDVLDPAIVAQLDSATEHKSTGPNPQASPPVPRGSIVSDSIRFLKDLPSGRRLYLATTTGDQLILILTDDGKLASAVGVPPLPTREPIAEAMIDDDFLPSPRRLTFGIAQDGITAVSFVNEDGGSEQTVPVNDNVWAYEGAVMPQWEITVHYADGTTQTPTNQTGPCVIPFHREGDKSSGPIWCATAPTYFWFPDPDSPGATAATTPWVFRYFDPEQASTQKKQGVDTPRR